MMRLRLLAPAIFFFCLAIITTVIAAPVIIPQGAAGVVEREIEREYQAIPLEPQKPIPILEVDIPEQQLDIVDGEQVFIQHIEFSGNDTISSAVLEKIVTDYTNRELTMKEIREVCLIVQSKYVTEGYFLARVYPPPQEIKDGVLTLDVMEGKLGDITVVGNKHYHADFVRRYFEKYKDKAINYEEFLKTLLIINDNWDLTVGTIFKKGSQVGTADLILRVQDKRPLHTYIDYNNYGSPFTTQHRSGARIDCGNVLLNGDQLTLVEVLGYPPKRLSFSDVVYNAPLNTRGTILSLAYLYSGFKVPRLPELHLKGQSKVATVKVTQAMQRTRAMSTDFFANFDYKQIKNLVQGNTSSFDKLRVLSMGINFDSTDQAKGRNSGDFFGTMGIPRLFGGLKNVDNLCSRKGAGGKFIMFNLDYRRIQQLPKATFLMVTFSGQFSFYKLPVAEQFYIGGFDTVRGFQSAIALGDSGYYTNIEFRIPPFGIAHKRVPWMKKPWKDFLQFIGFVDHGDVFIKKHVQANERAHTSLTGIGTGIRVYGPWDFNFSMDVGFPLTDTDRSSDAVFYMKLSWQPL